MKLIVGLGNPGPKYQLTRHNIGFLIVDALALKFAGARQYKNEFKSETQKIEIAGQAVILCKPQTFMNLSGEAVQPLLNFYGTGLSDLLVIHDEVDQNFGNMKFQMSRGHGGHNGIRNIHQLLGTDAYARLRLGVGRPPVFVNDSGEKTKSSMEIADWVLQNFSKSEQVDMPALIEMALGGIETWVTQGTSSAATIFNGKELERKGS